MPSMPFYHVLVRVPKRVLRSYCVVYCLTLLLVWARGGVTMSPNPHPQPKFTPPRPENLSSVYIHVKSQPVREITASTLDTIDALRSVVALEGYVCLAAVHLGTPARIVVGAGRVFINPTLVDQGSTLSKARESSAFYPKRPPVLMTRFVPVTIAYMDEHSTALKASFDGPMAHCILHTMDQFEGRSIYEVHETALAFI